MDETLKTLPAPPEQAALPASSEPAASARPPRLFGKGAIIIVLLALALVALLLVLRHAEHGRLAEATDELAVPTVTTVHPAAGPNTTEIVLPGNLLAFSEASIYARTSGYLKSWSTDIGAHVKAGQIMAVIETPDVDAQLLRAQANLGQAQANLENAQLDFNRQKELLDKQVSSRQEFDQKRTGLEAMQAAVKADEAAVLDLTAQKSFQNVIAPFDGIVTRRNTDLGALISEGTQNSMGNDQELFHIARTDILRAYIYIPQAYSSLVSVGQAASIEVPEFPGQKFQGKVSNIAGAIDPTSRTLLVEVQVPNADERLLPGSFVSVHLTLALPATTVIPVNTLLFRKEGPQVAVVDSDDTVHLHNIVIGRDFGMTLQVVSGVSLSDAVIANPPDSVSEGMKVHVAPPPAASPSPAAK